MALQDRLQQYTNDLLTPSSGDLISMYVPIGLTAAILFFSISMIPFQQYADRYTPKLFRYLWRRRSFVAWLASLAILTAMLLLLPLFEPIVLTDSLSIVITILILLCIVRLWFFTTELMDPGKHLLPAIEKHLTRQVQDCVRASKDRQRSLAERSRELTDMMTDA